MYGVVTPHGPLQNMRRIVRPPSRNYKRSQTMAMTFQVTIDCADPDRLAKFWAAALGYQLQPPPEGFDTWIDFLKARGIPESLWNSASAIVDPAGAGPRIFFQQVPE